uniref:Uncharacterized protein n=1 Tax=Solanum tuberosum TaxID=4113 RepID=M1DNW6_SOLTU
MIRVNSTGNHESTSKDLSTVQKSNDSILQIERSTKAISGEIAAKSSDVRRQFRTPSDEKNEVSTTGESSPGQGVNLTKISNYFDGEISGDIKSDKGTGAPVNNGNEESHQMTHCNEDNLCKVIDHLSQQRINVCSSSNLQDQATAKDDHHNKGEELESIRMTSLLNQENNHDKTHTSIQRTEPLQHDQEKMITKETTDGNMKGKMQGNQEATTKGTQAAQHTNAKDQTGISNGKQHGKGEKVNWRVKD